MCDKGRIVRVADNDSRDAFCATVGMECVGWNGMSAECQADGEVALEALVGQYISLRRLASGRASSVLQRSY